MRGVQLADRFEGGDHRPVDRQAVTVAGDFVAAKPQPVIGARWPQPFATHDRVAAPDQVAQLRDFLRVRG